MNIKFAFLACAAMVAAAAVAAPKGNKGKASDADDSGESRTHVTVDQYPRLGKQIQLASPSIQGGSTIGQCYTGKPRYWQVLETKYSTTAKVVDRLTFAWHVVLETKSATNKDREGQKSLSPYSYFNTTTTYINIPRGAHAASVCLHPSFLECYGEVVAVALVISDSEGNVIGGGVSPGSKAPFADPKNRVYKFWEDSKLMDATGPNGLPMITRRQGLTDRSKTVWALVNPNDYEAVAQ